MQMWAFANLVPGLVRVLVSLSQASTTNEPGSIQNGRAGGREVTKELHCDLLGRLCPKSLDHDILTRERERERERARAREGGRERERERGREKRSGIRSL